MPALGKLIGILSVSTCCLSVPALGQSTEHSNPKLILQITVDQLRADMPRRIEDRLAKGGFRYLYGRGTDYTNAHHPHANTETIVGHATLATGAYPSAHGMIGNIWLDRESGNLTYNIEDARYPLLSADAGVDSKTEIDPTQRAARSQGRSPSAILVSTFSDELAQYFNGQSKIFGVSVKDRGAVSMAGHSGKAFWFSKQSGEFVTSRFYYDQYPAWVTEWNAKRLAFSYEDKSWELLHAKSTYLFGDHDDMEYETDFPGYGRVFPHPFGKADSRYFTTLLTLSPVGDVLTLDFAKTLIEKEGIGEDEIPDYLAVSFSSTDYVGHLFGPSSLESEDNLLRLDRLLEEFFEYLDRRIGLESVLIVLSADHGAAEIPGRLNEYGIEARYFKTEEIDKQQAIQALKQRFGIGEELVTGYYHPYVYLNRSYLEERNLDASEVEAAVADEIAKFEGIALALPSTALRNGNVPQTPLTDRILRNYNPKRSGDIYLVFEPHWFVNDFDGLTVAASHGSPWRYDTSVPILFAGHCVTPQKVFREVSTVDVAATLAAVIGTKPPSGQSGNPLEEILQGQSRCRDKN
ncbi:MAG: alkaline phosphatase family protein [Acidobacteriota bacterium]|nr:MAG: alkaline phosphatase family protein [Acidobacteriota bacterium]